MVATTQSTTVALSPRGDAGRRGVTLPAALIVGTYTAAALSRFVDQDVESLTKALLTLSLLLPGVSLIVATHSSRYSLAQSCAWTWHFVFLGLVPAYQVPEGTFYWAGKFDTLTVNASLATSLTAQLVLLLVVRWRRRPNRILKRHLMKATEYVTGSGWTDTWLMILQVVQTVACLGLIALVGIDGLISGRRAFQDQLVVTSSVGIGTAFFLGTSLSIVVPAAGIYIWRRYRVGNPFVVAMSTFLGAVVTNPFIGSRFLTGSFLVAVVGAWTAGWMINRLIGPSMIFLLTTVFPSLDLWRGGGLGSQTLAFMWPSESLRHGDFDAFEMMTRAISLEISGGVESIDRLRLMLGALLKYVPLASNYFPIDSASGYVVARRTGMGFSNVSMPLPGEGSLMGGIALVGVFYALLGLLFRWLGNGVGSSAQITPVSVDASVAALLFLTLRGSLYSTLGYVLVAVICGRLLGRTTSPAVKEQVSPTGGTPLDESSSELGMTLSAASFHRQ